ncbi:hypothetical protein JCM5353_004269 [Sporobolomyces roseus]
MPNLVIYIVPAVFGIGLIVALFWWIHLSSKRRARGEAFSKKANDVEARIAPIPPSLSLFTSRTSSASLNTILEKSFEPPTIPPLVFSVDSLASLPPTYSSDWKVSSRVVG